MNKLYGEIVNIQSSKNLSLIFIKISDDVFSSVVLDNKEYKIKDHVTIVFKETEVGLVKHFQGMISIRNRFKALITKIEWGDILTKVTLNYKNQRVESIVSTLSATAMQLKENDQLEWLVKTNEITLMKGVK